MVQLVVQFGPETLQEVLQGVKSRCRIWKFNPSKSCWRKMTSAYEDETTSTRKKGFVAEPVPINLCLLVNGQRSTIAHLQFWWCACCVYYVIIYHCFLLPQVPSFAFRSFWEYHFDSKIHQSPSLCLPSDDAWSGFMLTKWWLENLENAPACFAKKPREACFGSVVFAFRIGAL